MKSKKIILPFIILFFAAGTLFITPQAEAFNFGAGGDGLLSNLIQFISQKFGLDKNQVQNAVNEYKNQVRASITPRPTLSPQDIQAREKSRLDYLVQRGKITADQKKAILDELTTIRSKYSLDNLKNLTPDQRRTKLQEMQNELKDWAKAHNIDQSFLVPGFGFGRFGGMSGFEKKGMMGKYGRGMWGNPRSTHSPTP